MRDVVVLGGGPAGSVCAARLASKGRDVVVLERARHPRFHLGESLLPASLEVLGALGVLGEVSSRYQTKRGARFVDGADATRWRRYAFAEAFHARHDHAFQVPRDDFDELLFRHAGRAGAEVREGWAARRLVRDGDRVTGVEAAPSGGDDVEVLRARFVVDATGRDALVARAAGDTAPLPGLDRTALYTQVRGAWRDAADQAGDIQIVVAGRGAGPADRAWLWLIPFADGRTSVGAVVSRGWVTARQGASPAVLLDEAVASAPAAAAMLAGSEQLFAPEAAADFSFRVGRWRGPGWLAVGDAGGFIDPLFSTGVHLALHGALAAADALDAALADDAAGLAALGAWEAELRAGAELFLGVVQAFYAGELDGYLFAEQQHPFLRRAITSLLAGDVFDAGTRWAAELRARFPVRG